MKLSVVVPCYNEEQVLPETIRRLTHLTSQWIADELIDEYELVFVDDGSRDRTLELLRRFSREIPCVRVLSFSANFGHQSAILAGMHRAKGDVVVTLDADLQDPPETVTEMLGKVREGYQIVYGVRSSRQKDSFFKRWTAHAFYKLMHFMGIPIVYDHADYRMLTRPVLTALGQFQERALFLRGIFPLMGFQYCLVEYERPERFAGDSKYPLRNMLLFAVNGITSFTYAPLRLAFFLGAAVFVLSLGMASWAIITWLSSGTIHGWTSIVVPLYVFAGLQMIFIGIVGEYLGKVFQEVKARPRYIVQEEIGPKSHLDEESDALPRPEHLRGD